MKKILWMLIANLNNNEIHTVIPTVAWIAKENGVEFECYLECKRTGELFAKTGSTVISGHHFQQFNYLNNIYDVKYIYFGKETYIFKSTVKLFEKEVIADTEDADTLYNVLLGDKYNNYTKKTYGSLKNTEKDFSPYIYPDIYFNRYLAYSDESYKDENCADTYFEMTTAIAEKYADKAKGVAFGDPDAILSMLPLLCREEKIALYGETEFVPDDKVIFSQYTEMKSSANHITAKIAHQTGNLVLVGRQTSDGDLFEWAKEGVCIQIMDPNRPAFPIVKNTIHKWSQTKKDIYSCEPSDDELKEYAKSGKTLASIIVHSGEMAHNEAMIHFIDYVNYTGIKFGIAVHSARYETCPQFWELIQIPVENGGVLGHIEPVLHSGGMGIMAEINCPPDYIKKHIQTSLARIKKIAPQCCPKGYYAFCDTDLKTMTFKNENIYKAIYHCGLEYVISSVTPGKNRTVFQLSDFSVINQSECRVETGSPFLRIADIDVIKKEHDFSKPGWIIGTVDAPVVAFPSYIWSKGNQFDELAKFIVQNETIIPATPHTIYRYSKILERL